MTAPAAPAEGKAVVVDAYASDREALRKLPGDNSGNLSRRTVADGAAVNNQRVHTIPPYSTVPGTRWPAGSRPCPAGFRPC